MQKNKRAIHNIWRVKLERKILELEKAQRELSEIVNAEARNRAEEKQGR